MKHILGFLFILFCSCTLAMGQPFSVGHLSLNVYDATRSGGSAISGAINWGTTGRAIGTEIYYPATSTGNNTPAANGQFPIVVFGHGFLMSYDSYNTLYEELVKEGFIVALPVTEGGIAPVHADYGADMAYLAGQLPLLNNNNVVSILLNRVSAKAAIGGHSMGAGCSMVGAQNNTGIYALFNMATATSNTNGISSLVGAPSISAPTLILSGERDCVADTNVQVQHYTASGASLKYLAILKNVTHCDFGNGSSLTCTLGQTTSGCGNTIPNSEANAAVLYYLLPFLERTLKNNCLAADTFMHRITNSHANTLRTLHEGNLACFPTTYNHATTSHLKVYPNPTQGNWTILNNTNNGTTHYSVLDVTGRTYWETNSTANVVSIPSYNWPMGMYWLVTKKGTNQEKIRLMKSK